jgi:hypothetical protein
MCPVSGVSRFPELFFYREARRPRRISHTVGQYAHPTLYRLLSTGGVSDCPSSRRRIGRGSGKRDRSNFIIGPVPFSAPSTPWPRNTPAREPDNSTRLEHSGSYQQLKKEVGERDQRARRRAHRRGTDMQGYGRIQADRPDLNLCSRADRGSEGSTFAHRPFHSIASASAPGAALLRARADADATELQGRWRSHCE